MNDLLNAEEKCGALSRPNSSFRGFKDFVDNCGLTDLGFLGHPFTWQNNRTGEGLIQERLDRVLASHSWCNMYNHALVTLIFTVGSDYYALKLDINPNLPKMRTPFRFDARWADDDEAHDVIQLAWSTPVHGSSFFSVFKRVQSCQIALTNWKRRKRGDESSTVEGIKDRIFALSNGSNSPPIGEIQKLKWQLQQFWDKEEMFWRQKSRINWLQHGDKNRKFFHASVMQRRARNWISGIEKADGIWTTEPLEIHSELCHFFSGLFEANPTIQKQETVEAIPNCVSDAMNRSLTRPVTDLEIHEALMMMGPTKAPGIDGMTALFYQSHWDIVGHDVCATIKSFFHSSYLLRSINQTLITLIPKVNNPGKPIQFCPISLCNVMYKLIAKIMANRLRPILPNFISENQTAFVGGHQISDSVLVAHEIMHAGMSWN